MAHGWYVVQVYTGYEKTVYNALVQRQHNEILDGILLDIRVPEEEYFVEKKGKKVAKKEKILPGYILAEMDIPDDETEWKRIYAEIRSITGFGMFLNVSGGNRRPVPLSYEEVRGIFERTGEIKTDVDRVEHDFDLGERVKVAEGPFKGFEGEIVEISPEKASVQVRVEIFGRLTPVELGFNQVLKL